MNKKCGSDFGVVTSVITIVTAVLLCSSAKVHAATSLNIELDVEMKSQYFLEGQILDFQLPTKEIHGSAYHVTLGHIDCVPDDKVAEVKKKIAEAMNHALGTKDYSFKPLTVDVFNPAGRAKTIVLLPDEESAGPMRELNGILAQEVLKIGQKLDIPLNLNALTAPDGPNGGYRPHLAVNTASISQHDALYASKIKGIKSRVSKFFHSSGKTRVSLPRVRNEPKLKLRNNVTILSWKVPKGSCPEGEDVGKQGKIVDGACFNEEEVLSANSKTGVKQISDVVDPQKEISKDDEVAPDNNHLHDMGAFEDALGREHDMDANGCTSQEVETSQREADRLAIKRMEILHVLSPTSGAKLVGSAAAPGTHAFPADIDGFEKISFRTKDKAEASQKFSDLIQRMLGKAMESEDPPLYFEEMKAGVDPRFNEVNSLLDGRCEGNGVRDIVKAGSLKKLRTKLDGLLKSEALTAADRKDFEDKIEALVAAAKVRAEAVAKKESNRVKKIVDEDVDQELDEASEHASIACQKLNEEVRKRRILRWNADEILAGFKLLPGIKPTLQNPGMTLDEALKHSTIVKLDVGAIVDGRLVEITNFFYASQLSGTSRTAEVMNQPMKDDYIGELKKDVFHYAEEGNWMKAAKRRWRIADLMADKATLRKLNPLFETHASALYQVASELETLGNLIKKKDLPPNDGVNGMDEVLQHILDKLENCLPDEMYSDRVATVKPLFRQFMLHYRTNRAALRKDNPADLRAVIKQLNDELNAIRSILKEVIGKDTRDFLEANDIDLEDMPEHDRHN